MTPIQRSVTEVVEEALDLYVGIRRSDAIRYSHRPDASAEYQAEAGEAQTVLDLLRSHTLTIGPSANGCAEAPVAAGANGRHEQGAGS